MAFHWQAGPMGGGGYSGFQVTGITEGFLGGGLKFSIPGCFWVGKFGKYSFGWLDLSRDFLGIQNNLKNCGSACVTDNQTCFAVVLIIFNDGVTLHCICYIKQDVQ